MGDLFQLSPCREEPRHWLVRGTLHAAVGTLLDTIKLIHDLDDSNSVPILTSAETRILNRAVEDIYSIIEGLGK